MRVSLLAFPRDCQPGCRATGAFSVWGGTGMEMDLNFKPGDVVQLNSGGPRMTVVAVQSDGTLRCNWFRDDGTQDNGVFAHGALRNAKQKNRRRAVTPAGGGINKPPFVRAPT